VGFSYPLSAAYLVIIYFHSTTLYIYIYIYPARAAVPRIPILVPAYPQTTMASPSRPNAFPQRHTYPTPDLTPPLSPTQALTVLVSSRAVITDEHDNLILCPATISVSPITGKIVSVVPGILPATAFPQETNYVDHTPHILMPGLVDAHVHLNEPGRTEWEGFWTGTRAAASGGVTTVIDMPLNAIPPTTTLRGLEEKIRAAQGQCWVDVGFYGGLIPGNADELVPLVEAGVRGFKGFLIESGVSSHLTWFLRLQIFPLTHTRSTSFLPLPPPISPSP
jgi:allantoinase